MSQEKLGLGKLIPDNVHQERDAIHIAVIPMLAAEALRPGEHIGLPFEGDQKVAGKSGVTLFIGIVDPYLDEPVKPGDKFWMYLYPGSITSLRHQWEHPVLPEAKLAGPPPNVSASEAWIRDYAESLGTGYKTLMSAAEEYLEYDSYFVEGGKFEGVSTNEDFWGHFEKMTGKSIGSKSPHFFSCSC